MLDWGSLMVGDSVRRSRSAQVVRRELGHRDRVLPHLRRKALGALFECLCRRRQHLRLGREDFRSGFRLGRRRGLRGRFEASDSSLFSGGELLGLKMVEGFGVPGQRDGASEDQQEAGDLALLGEPAVVVVWEFQRTRRRWE